MSLDQAEFFLQRYRRDDDRQSFSLLVDALTPLVRSICRRHLQNAHDVDDACQDVFIKLARHADDIRGNLVAWVSRTTRTTSIDILRRRIRQRRQREAMMDEPGPGRDGVLTWEVAMRRLDEALAGVDPRTKQLIVERFMHGRPLREIAEQRDVSVPSASRHVSRALVELRAAFEELGVNELDEAGLSDALWSAPGACVEGCEAHTDASLLRYAYRPVPVRRADLTGERRGPDGWARPIRVGVFVGYQTSTTPLYDEDLMWYMDVDLQVYWAHLLLDPRYELVGVIEPGTADQPLIERTMRDYDLTAGLVDVTDPEAMASLDVVCIGRQGTLNRVMYRALRDAVAGGVGLFNFGSKPYVIGKADTLMLEMCLADDWHGCHTPKFDYHGGRHHDPLPVRVARAHPAYPGLQRGTRFAFDGTHKIFTHKPEAQPIVVYDRPMSPNGRCEACVGGTRARLEPTETAAVVAGSLGRGRVMYIVPSHPEELFEHPSIEGNFLLNIVDWLAEPNRPQMAG